MDYGQTQKQLDASGFSQSADVPQDFFTVGAGTNSEDINNVNPEDNLDLTNTQASWGPQFMQMPPENITEPIRNIETPPIPDASPVESLKPTKHSGNSTEQRAPRSEVASSTPELGQITPTEPQAKTLAAASSESEQKAQQYLGIHDLNSIKTTEKLNHHGMTAIDNAISKLGQDGDAASFYEMAREAAKFNIKSIRGGNAPW